MTYSTTMTSKGQITIPAVIRRNMGLKAGESVRFRFEKDNQVVIEKNDWKQGLSDLNKEVSTHLRNNKIKPLKDEELDVAINESSQEAATERYQRSPKV
jgi:AbrB family looped-hinge helix DNA binding protein